MEDALTESAFAPHVEQESRESALVEAAKHDVRAFGELYERYHNRVYRYVYHRVGMQTDAEDITAAVFMKALEALPAYQARRNGFAPWLFRIAHNAVVDHYRRHKIQRSYDDLDQEAADPDPLAHVLGNERRDELHSLVQCLSPEQREVVLMRYAADLSFKEIAAVLKKNEPAIRMLLHRGLRRLKAVMDGDGQ